jgi:predicted DNA-binding protein with PD1-like motif
VSEVERQHTAREGARRRAHALVAVEERAARVAALHGQLELKGDLDPVHRHAAAPRARRRSRARRLERFLSSRQDLLLAPALGAINHVGARLQVQRRHADLGKAELIGPVEAAAIGELVGLHAAPFERCHATVGARPRAHGVEPLGVREDGRDHVLGDRGSRHRRAEKRTLRRLRRALRRSIVLAFRRGPVDFRQAEDGMSIE